MAPKKAKKPKKLPPVTYQIHVEAVKAANVPAVDRGGTSDPYLLIQLVGGSQKVMSRFIENNLNPVWDQVLDPLDGYYVGNDVLRLQLVDKDRKQGSPDDDIISQLDLPLRHVPFGRTIEQTYFLLKCDKKGKVEKKSKHSGGTLTIRLNLACAGQAPFADAPWGWPLYTALVEFVSAANLPAADINGKSDPYVVAKVVPSVNGQKTKTKTINSTLNPTWNEQKTFLLGDGLQDSLQLLIYDKDVGSDDDKIGSVDVPLRDFAISPDFQERDYALKPHKGKLKGPGEPTIKIRVKITPDNPANNAFEKGPVAPVQPPPVEPVAPVQPPPQEEPVSEPPPVVQQQVVVTREVVVEEELLECVFEWESFSSSYTTNFTGYTNYANGTLSDLQPGQDELHHHIDPVKKQKPVEEPPQQQVQAEEQPQQPGEPQPVEQPKPPVVVRPVGPLVLSGVVIGANGIPKADSDGTDSYIVVAHVKKSTKSIKEEKSDVIHDTQDPTWQLPFDFGEVKKGEAIEFTIFQRHKVFKDNAIGYAKVEVKDIQLDDAEPRIVQLVEPAKFKKLKWKVTGWGTLRVVFNLKVK